MPNRHWPMLSSGRLSALSCALNHQVHELSYRVRDLNPLVLT